MIAALLLAAGEGRRFGRSPKPLALRGGRTLLAQAMAAARAAPAARLVVVVGRQGGRVAAAARAIDPHVRIVVARRWRDGLDASLAAGARGLWPIERRAFVFLADMPDVPHDLAARLLRQGGDDVRAGHRGKPGHPVLLGPAALTRVRKGAGPRPPMRLLPADRRCRADIDHRHNLARRVPALMR